MRRMQATVLGITAAAALCGCTTVYRVSESIRENHTGTLPARPAMRDLVVRVDVSSPGGQAEKLVAPVKMKIEDNLAARGFTLASKRRPDAVVAVALTSRVKDQLADWVLYEGSADVRASEVASGKVIAANSFTAGSERTLDREKATRGVAEGLSRQMLPWLEKVLPARKVALPPPPPGPAVSYITIAPADLSENPSAVLAVQRRFMDAIAEHPGVVDCRLEREAPAKRAYTFRVAYDPACFPGGLLNTLVLDAPELGDNVALTIVDSKR